MQPRTAVTSMAFALPPAGAITSGDPRDDRGSGPRQEPSAGPVDDVRCATPTLTGRFAPAGVAAGLGTWRARR